MDYSIVMYSMNVDSRRLDVNVPTLFNVHQIYEPYPGKKKKPTYGSILPLECFNSTQSFGYTICPNLAGQERIQKACF